MRFEEDAQGNCEFNEICYHYENGKVLYGKTTENEFRRGNCKLYEICKITNFCTNCENVGKVEMGFKISYTLNVLN